MFISHILPTTADLVARAIAETDYLGDLSREDLHQVAADAADSAAELWEEAHHAPVNATVPIDLILRTRAALVDYGEQLLAARDDDAENERRDAIEAGIVDRHGELVRFVTYRSA